MKSNQIVGKELLDKENKILLIHYLLSSLSSFYTAC